MALAIGKVAMAAEAGLFSRCESFQPIILAVRYDPGFGGNSGSAPCERSSLWMDL